MAMIGGGGTYLKMGYMDVQPSRPLLMPLLPLSKSSVEVQICSQGPHLKEKFYFLLPKSIILRNYESMAIFIFRSSNLAACLVKICSQGPTFMVIYPPHKPLSSGNPGRTYPTRTKVECPPGYSITPHPRCIIVQLILNHDGVESSSDERYG